MEPVATMREGTTAPRRPGASQVVFGLTMLGLGILMLQKGGFLAIWSGVPKDMPLRMAFAYLCAALCVGSGLGLLVRRTAAIAARVLLGLLVLWMLCFRLNLVFRAPNDPSVWWACGETAFMIGTAWVLAIGNGRGFDSSGKSLRIARALFAFGLIQFGIGHFTFLQRTVSMVPGWLPGHLGWAWFTGGSLIAAGVAIVVGVFARLAAGLSALELALFTLLVWGPVVVAHPDAGQWNEFVDSCLLTIAAWVVAESWRGTRVER